MKLPEALYQLTERDLSGNLVTEVSATTSLAAVSLIVSTSLLIPNPDRQLFIVDSIAWRGLDGATTVRVGEVLVEVSSSDGTYGNGKTLGYADFSDFTNGSISVKSGRLHTDLLLGVHPDYSFLISGTFLQSAIANTVQLTVHGWLVAPGGIYS